MLPCLLPRVLSRLLRRLLLPCPSPPRLLCRLLLSYPLPPCRRLLPRLRPPWLPLLPWLLLLPWLPLPPCLLPRLLPWPLPRLLSWLLCGPLPPYLLLPWLSCRLLLPLRLLPCRLLSRLQCRPGYKCSRAPKTQSAGRSPILHAPDLLLPRLNCRAGRGSSCQGPQASDALPALRIAPQLQGLPPLPEFRLQRCLLQLLLESFPQGSTREGVLHLLPPRPCRQ